MDITRRTAAEFFGTFWLTFGGCGAAVLAAGFPSLGHRLPWCRACLRPHRADDGLRGRAHLRRPLQSCGHRRAMGRRAVQRGRRGALRHSAGDRRHRCRRRAILDRIRQARLGPRGFASNGYGDLSPGKYSLGSCLAMEVLMTFFFLLIIIGCTSKGAAVGFAGIPIGLALTLIHLVSIPVTNTSVNPARSTGPALFAGGEYVGAALAVLAGTHRRRSHRRVRDTLVARTCRDHRVGHGDRGIPAHRLKTPWPHDGRVSPTRPSSDKPRYRQAVRRSAPR